MPIAMAYRLHVSHSVRCKVGQSKLKIKVDQYVGVAGSTVARISTRWFSGSTYCRTRLKCNEENQERIRIY